MSSSRPAPSTDSTKNIFTGLIKQSFHLHNGKITLLPFIKIPSDEEKSPAPFSPINNRLQKRPASPESSIEKPSLNDQKTEAVKKFKETETLTPKAAKKTLKPNLYKTHIENMVRTKNKAVRKIEFHR